MIYDIPTTSDPLKEVAAFLFHMNRRDLSKCRVFLPNKRSRTALKKIIAKQTDLFTFPQLDVISDEFDFDKQKITMLIVRLLKIRNVPKNVIYELSSSLCDLLIELTIQEAKNLQQLVPPKLQEYWSHTISILNCCLNDEEVSRELKIVDTKFKLFIQSIPQKQIISVGIGGTNRYTQMFLKSVAESSNGVVFMIGTDDSKNHDCNRKLLKDLSLDHIPHEILATQSPRNCVEFCECSDTNEEASIIALAIRREISHKSILVVTSDKKLGQKIKTELQRWNIAIDDSSGTKFSQTSEGQLILKVLGAIEFNFQTFETIDMLKNGHFEDLQNLELSIKKCDDPPKFFRDALKMFENSIPDFADFQNLDILTPRSFNEWYGITLKIASCVCEVNQFVEVTKTFKQYSDLLGQLTFNEYKLLLINEVLSASVRVSTGYTGNVVMVGMLEAQLLSADFIVIAGANERNLTASEKDDFWFSKSMLNKLKINSSDAKNEFLQCIFERLVSKSQVLITRSKIVDGISQPKFSYLDKVSSQIELRQSTELIDLFEEIKNSYHMQKVEIISPNPPLNARPSRFSISDIGLLKNNPYAFYAKKILKLHELCSGSADSRRGNYVHSILEEFFKSGGKSTSELLQISQKMLLKKGISQSDFGIWFFRLKKIFEFVVANINNQAIYNAEIKGECSIGTNPEFSIYCKADRIDILDDGSVAIVDYKTGKPPTEKEIVHGFKPQLPLEAIIASNGGFPFGKRLVSSFCYWKLADAQSGGAIAFKKDAAQVADFMEKTLEGLQKLIYKYNINGIPYDPNLHTQKNYASRPKYDYLAKYNHLARIKDLFDD